MYVLGGGRGSILVARGMVRSVVATGTVLETTAGTVLQICQICVITLLLYND